ncbi:MAG: hypothetical protein IJ300_00180 [Clostridia bacterium]|nr:hypothetical protein [Clostridia bacterium]
MKKSLLTALSLLLTVALLVVPLLVSASTAQEQTFDPVSTMWYSVEYVRTDGADASEDAYVYTWAPEADGVLTLEPDTACKDAYVAVVNTSNTEDNGAQLRYYPQGGYNSDDSVTYNVEGGSVYEISIMTCSEKSGTVSFFAYFTATSASGLQGSGTYSDPYLLDNKGETLPALDAGETLYYLVLCDKTQVYDLAVRGATTKDTFDLCVENNGVSASAQKGSASVKTITPFAASGYIMFSITNAGTEQSLGYAYTVTKAENLSTKGTYDDPATLTLDTLTTAEITAVCYYYTYTATQDGTLSVQVANEDNWVCSISGGAAEAAYCTSDDTPVVNPVEYSVAQGDEITLWVATAEFGAGTVSFTATLKTEDETTVTDPVETTTAPTEPAEVTTAPTEPAEVTTAPTDPVEVTTAPTDPAEVTTAPTDPAEVTTAPTEPAEITTAPTEPAEVTTAPTATDPEGAFTELYDEYCLSAQTLALGENKITTSNVYPVTLFEFTPEEYAVYTITADNADAFVGAYIGTVNYIPAGITGDSSSATITFSSGRDIIIAVSNTSSCTLTIEKTGDVVIEQETPWDVYTNIESPVAYESQMDVTALTNVMIYDDIVNSAVLGSDGYYHLGSADGEILYVNLNSATMSFVKIVENSKLGAVFYDEQGEVTAKIDFTEAVLEYINNAAQIANGEDIFYLYPLTADLIEMYQTVGLANDWYGYTGWVGGEYDDAWMFACYYQEGAYTAGDAVTPDNPSTIPTGRDFTMAYVAASVMLLAGGVVVFTRKKLAVK